MNYAILLAAGLSNRMGKANKLLLKDQKDIPMICNSLNALQKSNVDKIILVTGFQSEQVLSAVQSFSFTKVHNPNFESGQTSSIQAGVSILPPDCKSFMICLADMPFITSDQYNKILIHFSAHFDGENPIIVRPTYNNKPGHPVCFSASFKRDILDCKEKEGCRSVLKNNYKNVVELEINGTHFYTDIDTPSDASNSNYTI